MNNLEPQIKGKINAKDISIGKGVIVEEGVEIHAEKVILGDFCFIGRESRIIVPDFRLGDYTKLHAFSFAHGKEPMHIGRNCWIGGNVVLDSLGVLVIDDGVGIGSQSQIWTHIQFGDIVEGCRDQWFGNKTMYIGKDAWFVGHCIVSPVNIGERSMALLGSVVTKDMKPNHVYAGSPAQDITDKVGTQFEERTTEEKTQRLEKLLRDFEQDNPHFQGQIGIARTPSDNLVLRDHSITVFNMYNRTYTRTYSEAEVSFLKRYVPLIKFTPENEPAFVDMGVLDV